MTSSDVKTTTVLEAVRDIVPVLRANGRESENRRWIADENIKLLDDAGVFRMATPRRFGGLELPLADQAAVLAEISRGCVSTGWTSVVWLSSAWIATLYPDRAQEEVFANPSVRVSGGFTPTGTIRPVDGGYVLNGSWRFNTGCRGADWNMTAAILELPDGTHDEVVALVPMREFTIADDWDVFAATATGSSTSTAEDVFVPAHRVVGYGDAVMGTTGDRSNGGTDGREYGLIGLIVAESAAAYVGGARGAYELFLDRVPGRGVTYTDWTDQREYPVTQIQVASAANKLTAAEALIARAVTVLQNRADRGEQPTVPEKAAIRGETAYAVQLAKEATEVLFSASGATVIQKSVPFQRFHRDLQGLSLHGFLLLTTNLEVQGRTILGLDPGSPFL
ncbi:MAG: acyl-CoA dehydrogenase family protein [Actinoplanes sp.]